MKTKIMIIGGAGHVGKTIARDLVTKYPEKVVIAGRNQSRLDQFILKESLRATSRQIDVSQVQHPDDFADVGLVVVCLDQTTTQFVEFCQREKIAYVDVSANSDFYDQLTQLGALNQAPVVYSVGLAPGLTNLAAVKVITDLPDFEEVRIKISLGLGDSHGAAAIAWTLAHLATSYQLQGKQVSPFTTSASLTLPDEKKLPVYNFNFSDQHSLALHYPGKIITTFLGFDLPFATRLIAASQRIGLLKLTKNMSFQKQLGNLMAKGVIGSDRYWVQVTAINHQKNQEAAVTLTGNNEALATGKIAAVLVDKVFQNQKKTGLLSMTDYCTYAEVVEEVQELEEITIFNERLIGKKN